MWVTIQGIRVNLSVVFTYEYDKNYAYIQSMVGKIISIYCDTEQKAKELIEYLDSKTKSTTV